MEPQDRQRLGDRAVLDASTFDLGRLPDEFRVRHAVGRQSARGRANPRHRLGEDLVGAVRDSGSGRGASRRERGHAGFEALGGRPVIAEDTGPYFEVRNGLPGALIKWFVGSVGVVSLCRMMRDIATATRGQRRCLPPAMTNSPCAPGLSG
jgi:hypothetical protein